MSPLRPDETKMRSSPPWSQSLFFDGGETGCGELLLDLMLYFRRSPGQLIAVRALDPGAPHEIPAWCRLSGHSLQEAAHPFYLIQAKA
jgi:tRNA 2-thiouridine synthesizing protein A